MPYASRAPEVVTDRAAVPVPLCVTLDSLPAVEAVARHPTTGPAPWRRMVAMASTRGPWPKVSMAWAMLVQSTGVAAVPLDEQPTTARGRSV